jgi:RNA polymerase sigma factor (sigma-70 family)
MLLTSTSWKSLNKFSDPEVWDQLREGDHRALEYLYRTYGKDLFNFGMKLYGRHDWVQDTLQELFVDLWKQHQKLSVVTSLKTYLFKAFKYKLHRQYGKEKRWVYHVDYERLPEMEVELPEESRIISDQLSREQQLKLAKAIEKLPARQKEVLHLLFDQGLSYEEVAGIMEINVRSVYTLAWKGISSLRKLIIDFIFLFAVTAFSF